MRLFAAIPVPAAIRPGLLGQVAEWEKAWPKARWTDPADWHVTLRFLGDVPDGCLPAVVGWFYECLKAPAGGRLELGKTGYFKQKERFVLWAGFENAEWMGRMAGRLGGEVAGVKPDAGPFHPHLTLARVRGEKGGFQSFLSTFTASRLPSLSARAAEVVLYQSELSAVGAHHKKMATVPFLP